MERARTRGGEEGELDPDSRNVLCVAEPVNSPNVLCAAGRVSLRTVLLSGESHRSLKTARSKFGLVVPR